LPDIILDSFVLIITVLLILFSGFILLLLGKIPLFRWIGIVIITTIKYAFITILNVLAIGIISGVSAIGVALVLDLFYYFHSCPVQQGSTSSSLMRQVSLCSSYCCRVSCNSTFLKWRQHF